MSHVGVPRGTARKRRSVALLATGVLTIPVLAGCTSDSEDPTSVAVPQDIAPASRDRVADGSTLNWAIDAVPSTLNAFQADADGATTRITGALLPSLFPMDAKGEPRLNPDYLESAKVIEQEPKQVVLYKLNQQAVWSDGREIGAPDFVAQWRALSGKDSAFWTARNAGYERIEKIERGKDDLQVRVTFSKPYADWRSLFSPLYPKEVTGSPGTFNDGARTTLRNTAGPFRLRSVNKPKGTVVLDRNPRWWGDEARLDSLVFRAVEPGKRTDALAEGTVDVADIDPATANSIALAARYRGGNGGPPAHGPGAGITPAAALRSWALAHGSDEEAAETARAAREETREAVAVYAAEQKSLSGFAVRKSLEPSYTQLALNGESGPLSDDRVRRAIARTLDRQELADAVLKPLGLPAKPPAVIWPWPGSPGTRTAAAPSASGTPRRRRPCWPTRGGPRAEPCAARGTRRRVARPRRRRTRERSRRPGRRRRTRTRTRRPRRPARRTRRPRTRRRTTRPHARRASTPSATTSRAAVPPAVPGSPPRTSSRAASRGPTPRWERRPPRPPRSRAGSARTASR